MTTTNQWFDIEAPYNEYGKARVVIIPAPYEGTVSYGTGTSKGPEAIRRASRYIEPWHAALGSEPYRAGIYGRGPLAMPEDPWQAALKVKAAVGEELETGRRPVTVGGEHSLTVGAVSAVLERYPSVSVLQLDAHADLRDEYEGTGFSHACVMRRLADLGADFVQAGIRSMSAPEKEWLIDNNRKVISPREIRENSDWTGTVIEGLKNQVYITFDVDVLDPSQMPSTGTPEPGGLYYDQILDLVLALKDSGKEVVGLDIMELSPIAGLHHADFTAATILYAMIGAFFNK